MGYGSKNGQTGARHAGISVIMLLMGLCAALGCASPKEYEPKGDIPAFGIEAIVYYADADTWQVIPSTQTKDLPERIPVRTVTGDLVVDGFMPNSGAVEEDPVSLPVFVRFTDGRWRFEYLEFRSFARYVAQSSGGPFRASAVSARIYKHPDTAAIGYRITIEGMERPL